jgi:YVTN family beta-propeller protein
VSITRARQGRRSKLLFAIASGALAAMEVACIRPPAPFPETADVPSPSATAAPLNPTPHQALLVLSKRERTLAIVDPTTLGVVARVTVAEDPHEVVSTADGRTAYVSNYGSGTLHTLSVVDLVAQTPRPPVELGPLTGPHGLMERGGRIWFTAEGAKVVGAYDLQHQRVEWVLGTGQDRTHMIFVSEDRRRIVATNVSSGTVSFLEDFPAPSPGGTLGPAQSGPPRRHWEETVVPVARGAEGFDVSPDGKEIWVANAQPGSLSILDFASKTVTQTIDAGLVGANRLKFTPDGKHVLVSLLHGGGLVVYDVGSRALVKRLAFGHGSAGIQVQPDGLRAFVACTPDDDVAVVDLQTLEVVGHVKAGPEPDGMAWVSRP